VAKFHEVVSANINELRDTSHGIIRTKVRSTLTATAISVTSSRMARSRWPTLLHINSASLRFIHRDDMESEGYGKYLDQVEEV
jgi:peptide-methionine (R)-S-oxide reductase